MAFVLLWLAAVGSAAAETGANISGTKHDLSRYGPGGARAVGETRICIFCHTPHNAAALSPLWNKSLDPVTYEVYASPTLKVAQKLGSVPQPSGPTKLCLSCHDGTIALGAVLNPSGGIVMTGSGTLPSGSLSNFGVDLRGHHPVSFQYADSLPNPELASSPPPGLTYGAADEVHCSTCHEPHDNRYGRFLAKDNRYSALCTTCHLISGWSVSAHATSTASVAGILPRSPNDWPTYTQLNEWGCESCHTPHFAPTAEQLLIFTSNPPAFSCTTAGCHGSTPGAPHSVAGTTPGAASPRVGKGTADIGAQVQKASAHFSLAQAASPAGRSAPVAAGPSVNSVACADCHNPHVMNTRSAQPPSVTGPSQGVRGTDRNGVEVRQVTYEYEICFRCHADYSHDVPYVTRVLSGTNLRLAFDTNNSSFHPVVGPGWSPNVPSIPSSLYPTLRPSDIIACTSCHADDGGVSRGPHGSSYAPILKERYDTADGTAESYDVYALCYRCHERTSILSDTSFQKKASGRTTASGGGHSGHLSARASCAACHDAHGVNVTAGSFPGGSGDHTSLINFDIQTVQPLPGSRTPDFRKIGTYSGSCTLVCHGVTHNAWVYP